MLGQGQAAEPIGSEPPCATVCRSALQKRIWIVLVMDQYEMSRPTHARGRRGGKCWCASSAVTAALLTVDESRGTGDGALEKIATDINGAVNTVLGYCTGI